MSYIWLTSCGWPQASRMDFSCPFALPVTNYCIGDYWLTPLAAGRGPGSGQNRVLELTCLRRPSRNNSAREMGRPDYEPTGGG